MDDQKMLPSIETIRRFQMRAAALYEPPQINRNVSHRYKKTVSNRDISDTKLQSKDVKNIPLTRHGATLVATSPTRGEVKYKRVLDTSPLVGERVMSLPGE